MTDEEKILNKLYDYQREHTKTLCSAIKENKRALDASDTGTGKTFTSNALGLLLKLKLFVVCPKSVIKDWFQVADFFNAELYGVSNYELLLNCNYYKKYGSKNVMCPYINRSKYIKKNKKGVDKMKYLYKWKVPDDCLVIFDEVHRCKNSRSLHSELIKGITETNANILILSATCADKPEYFCVAGHILGIYPSIKDAKTSIRCMGGSESEIMKEINKLIFPYYGSRMKKLSLDNLFPKNTIYAILMDMEEAPEIQEQYKLIEKMVEKLKEEEEKTVALGAIIKARMRIEMLKVPHFIKFIKKLHDEENSVASFYNFTNSLLTVAHQLDTKCLVYGEQTIEDRMKNIDDFSKNNSRYIICNSRSGGVGISLHDRTGKYPVVTVVSPSWSAQDMLQVLGRCHRAGGKTPVKQYIIFCKNTIEEDIHKNIQQKINNIASLNDGDMLSYQIEGMTTEEDMKTTNEPTELEKLFIKLNVLQMKKQRLENDIRDTNHDLEALYIQIQEIIN